MSEGENLNESAALHAAATPPNGRPAEEEKGQEVTFQWEGGGDDPAAPRYPLAGSRDTRLS